MVDDLLRSSLIDEPLAAALAAVIGLVSGLGTGGLGARMLAHLVRVLGLALKAGRGGHGVSPVVPIVAVHDRGGIVIAIRVLFAAEGGEGAVILPFEDRWVARVLALKRHLGAARDLLRLCPVGILGLADHGLDRRVSGVGERRGSHLIKGRNDLRLARRGIGYGERAHDLRGAFVDRAIDGRLVVPDGFRLGIGVDGNRGSRCVFRAVYEPAIKLGAGFGEGAGGQLILRALVHEDRVHLARSGAGIEAHGPRLECCLGGIRRLRKQGRCPQRERCGQKQYGAELECTASHRASLTLPI